MSRARWPRVRRMEYPTAYARKVLVNLALDAGRRRTRRPRRARSIGHEPTGRARRRGRGAGARLGRDHDGSHEGARRTGAAPAGGPGVPLPLRPVRGPGGRGHGLLGGNGEEHDLAGAATAAGVAADQPETMQQRRSQKGASDDENRTRSGGARGVRGARRPSAGGCSVAAAGDRLRTTGAPPARAGDRCRRIGECRHDRRRPLGGARWGRAGIRRMERDAGDDGDSFACGRRQLPEPALQCPVGARRRLPGLRCVAERPDRRAGTLHGGALPERRRRSPPASPAPPSRRSTRSRRAADRARHRARRASRGQAVGGSSPASGLSSTLVGGTSSGDLEHVTQTHLSISGDGPYTLVEGRTASGVTGVTLVRDDGQDVVATVDDGLARRLVAGQRHRDLGPGDHAVGHDQRGSRFWCPQSAPASAIAGIVHFEREQRYLVPRDVGVLRVPGRPRHQLRLLGWWHQRQQRQHRLVREQRRLIRR